MTPDWMAPLSDRFRSLRVRLLFPLLGVALVASIAVAIGSFALGGVWAQQEANSRYRAIESTLRPASFPLTSQVVKFIATLTETELLVVNTQGTTVRSSLPIPLNDQKEVSRRARNASLSLESRPRQKVVIGDRTYRFAVFARQDRLGEDDVRVAVLFDEQRLYRARLRAALLPLVTGLSTVVLLTSVTLFLIGRLVRRIALLQSRVNQIAGGDFRVNISGETNDELGVLARAVAGMARQLQSMWKTLERQQGQKLLHQVAGGLAHQLRNSITGARMAVELHDQQCDRSDDSLAVAISQLEQTEDHVRRLLLVASGKQDHNRPQPLGECIDWIRTTLTTTAKHLRVNLHWRVDESLSDFQVADGPSLHAAICNLGLNALQEATEVEVDVERIGAEDEREPRVQFKIADNGSGPPPQVEDELFEPFVTSKPEGLGLGLPLVKRAASRLHGEVGWSREEGRTVFVFTAGLTRPGDSSNQQDER